mmetsp:Transcript_34531/g.49048  ORF Transcript_34531/g.49048 Transcript_34531/m.49048 type:complete len:758 (+) Transcript_34531:2-2275(+)
MTVFLTCDEEFYDQEELSRMSRKDTFGVQRQHLLLDYESSNNQDVTISSSKPGFGLISIGRYGPFSIHDRKCKVSHEIKAWVFDSEPSEWAFGVTEPFQGCFDQIIDITDDVTGAPHSEACSHIPKYVNEVGHNTDLVQNVESREGDGRTVEYFLNITNPMKPGDKVELLTDYDFAYEATRERKGYGRRNLEGNAKSDHDEASRLEREFNERDEMIEFIHSLNSTEVYYALEFITKRIIDPLDKLLKGAILCQEKSSVRSQATKVSASQVVARIRLHWLKDKFVERIEALKKEKAVLKIKPRDQTNSTATVEKIYSGQVASLLHEQSLLLTSRLEWNIMREGHIWGVTQKIQKALDRELVDQVLHSLRKSFPFPMDKNIWCPLTRSYIRDTCLALSTIFRSQEIDKGQLPELFKILAEKAGNLARLVKQSITEQRLSQLWFQSGTEGKIVALTDKNYKLKSDFEGFSTVLKGAVSALHRHKCSGRGMANTSLQEINIHENVIMVRCSDNDDSLKSIPINNTLLKTGNYYVNDRWYVVWQAAFPLYCIGKGIVEKAMENAQDYLLAFCSRSIIRSVELASQEESILASFTDALVANHEPEPPVRFYPVKVSVHSKGSNACAKRKASAQCDRAPTKRQKRSPGVKRPRVLWLFDKLIWKTLTALGWTITWGNRATDRYFLPPGVFKRREFKVRVDYFDSFKQVINICQNHSQWKDHPEVRKCIELFAKCSEYLLSNRLPKGELRIDWLIEQINKKSLAG